MCIRTSSCVPRTRLQSDARGPRATCLLQKSISYGKLFVNVTATQTAKKRKKSRNEKYQTPALDKGLDILEHLAEVTLPESQSEIAAALGRTVQEIFRMLNTLEERGYVIRDPHSGKYTLSLRLFELAHSHSPVDQILTVARDPMREYAETMGQSCHLSILNRHFQFVLAHEESPEHITLNVKVGTKLPAVRSASGRVLLSALPEDRLETYLAEDREFADFKAADRKTFWSAIRFAQANRYLITESSNRRGVMDISALVGSPDAGLIAALASAVLHPVRLELDLDSLRVALQAKADEITRKVGLTR